MKKKLAIILTALILMLSFASCGNQNDSNLDTDSTNASESAPDFTDDTEQTEDSNTEQDNEIIDILLNNNWYNEIQCYNEYKFFEDGTAVENPGDFQRDLTYVIEGDDTIIITWEPGITSELKYVSKKDDINWEEDMFFFEMLNLFEEDEMFFYETGYVTDEMGLSNAMWLRKMSNDCGENLTWELTDDGELIISGTGEMYSYLDWFPSWNIDKSSIKKVTFGEGVTSIGGNAFFGCENLQSVNISSTVERIEYNAFGSTGITEATIPENVVSIESDIFRECPQLKKVTILNPNCTIEDLTSNTISNTATIYGYKNSTAEFYANKFGRNFVAINNNADENIPENINDLVLEACYNNYTDINGNLVIFDDETIETDSHFFLVVRNQVNDPNASANRLFADVTVDKSNGKMIINNQVVATLW